MESLWRKQRKLWLLVYTMNLWLLDNAIWWWKGWEITWSNRVCRPCLTSLPPSSSPPFLLLSKYCLFFFHSLPISFESPPYALFLCMSSSHFFSVWIFSSNAYYELLNDINLRYYCSFHPSFSYVKFSIIMWPSVWIVSDSWLLLSGKLWV